MTLKWMDGVDHYGDNGGARAIEGAFLEIGTIMKAGDLAGISPRTGPYFIGTGGYRRALGGDYRIAGLGEALYCTGMTSDSAAFISFRDANNETQIAVNRDSTGALRIWRNGDNGDSGTLIYTTATPVLTVGAWFHMEARIDCDAVNGALEVRVNGVTVVNLTGINTRPHTGAGRVSQTAAKKYGAGHPETCYDDLFAWAVDGITGETITDFVGDKRVDTDFPVADTTSNAFAIVSTQTARNNGAANQNASTSITLGVPSSPIIGEVWFAVLLSRDQNAHAFPDWTEIVQGNGAGSTLRMSVWYFRYNGTLPNMVATKTGSALFQGMCKAFKNFKFYGSPIDSVSAINTGSDATVEHPTLTPTQAGCAIFLVNTSAQYNIGSAPTGYTLGFRFTDNSAGGGCLELFYKFDQDGSATGVQVSNMDNANDWASVTIAIAPGADLPGFAAISEASPDDDGTYLSGDAVGIADFPVSNLPSNAGTVVAVQVVSRMKKTDAGTCNMQNAVLSAGVEAAGADIALTTAYAYYGTVFALNPATGAPWTPAERNALYLRQKRTS